MCSGIEEGKDVGQKKPREQKLYFIKTEAYIVFVLDKVAALCFIYSELSSSQRN